jgi:hypothetical protein
VAGCCEYGDEPSGSGATELVTEKRRKVNYRPVERRVSPALPNIFRPAKPFHGNTVCSKSRFTEKKKSNSALLRTVIRVKTCFCATEVVG